MPELSTIVFYVFSAILLLAASCVISVKNPVHAALFLVLAFFSASALWMLLKAEFLAWSKSTKAASDEKAADKPKKTKAATPALPADDDARAGAATLQDRLRDAGLHLGRLGMGIGGAFGPTEPRCHAERGEHHVECSPHDGHTTGDR